MERPDVEGTHYPEGIFIAKGPGIKAGATLPQMKIIDVAPCLLYWPPRFCLYPVISKDLCQRNCLILLSSKKKNHPYRIGEPTKFLIFDISREKNLLWGLKKKKLIFGRLKALGYVE